MWLFWGFICLIQDWNNQLDVSDYRFSKMNNLHCYDRKVKMFPALPCFRPKVTLQKRGVGIFPETLRSGYLDPFPTHTHTAPIINIFIEISHGQPDTVYSNWFQLIDHQSMSVLSGGKRHQYFWVYRLVWAHADIGWWKTSYRLNSWSTAINWPFLFNFS